MTVVSKGLTAQWAQWMRAAGWTQATINTKTRQMETLRRRAGVDSLTELSQQHVEAWLSATSSANTRFTYYQTIGTWSRWALARQLIPADLTVGLAKPKRQRGQPRPISDAVVAELLATTIPPVHSYVLLAAYAGLRVHEIAKLRGQDVDRAEGWLFVDGKGGHQAILPLHPALLELAATMPASGWWFPGHQDGHVSGQWVGEVIRAALRDVGSNATAHQLRHSFGTAVLRSSHDLRVTQELMRHADPSSTAVYTQVAETDKVDAIRALGWTA